MISLHLSDRRHEMRHHAMRLTKTGRVMVAMWSVALLMFLILVLAP